MKLTLTDLAVKTGLMTTDNGYTYWTESDPEQALQNFVNALADNDTSWCVVSNQGIERDNLTKEEAWAFVLDNPAYRAMTIGEAVDLFDDDIRWCYDIREN